MKKSFFLFFAMVAATLNVFAQECVETPTSLTGTASVTFGRYEHKILTGAFSVSASKHVVFAPGNLQYQASTDTWRFAEEQYETLKSAGYSHAGTTYYSGNATSTDRDTQSKWIDLFGWGTSGYNGGATEYQPWAVSTEPLDYGNNDNDISATEADWAYHNPIINGGLDSDGPKAHLWRTLLLEEWDYLLNTRTNASQLYSLGKLMDVEGIFLLPDAWNWSTIDGGTFEANWVGGNTSFTANVITDSSLWETLESAGVVFLPVTAYRNGTSLSQFSVGLYWSASAASKRSTSGILKFANGSVSLTGTSTQLYKYAGKAVRPVYDLD